MRIRNLCAAAALVVLVWSPTAARAETGYVTHSDIVFKGTIARVEDDRIQVKTASGPRLWVSPAADFSLGGDLVHVDDLQVGDQVTVAVDGGDSAVLRLNARTVTLQTDDGPTEIPVSLLGESTLNGSQVTVRLPDGKQHVVSMRRALDLVRHRGAGLVAVAAPTPVAAAPRPVDQVGGSDIVNGAPAGSADLVASGTAIARSDDDFAEGVGAAGGESREDDFDNAVSNRPTGSGTLPSRGSTDLDSTTASVSRPTDDQVGAAANPGTATAPSTGAQTGLGTLSSSSTAPSAGLGTLSTSSTGTQVGVGTLNASGSDSEPVDEVVLRGSDSSTATPVGHLNLTATQVLGTILEAGETEVVLQTATGRRMSVPAHFRMVGADGPAQNLSRDMDVTVELPEDSGPIVAVGEGTVSVQLSSGLVILPLELLPYSTVTDTRVYVEMANGNMQIMNLGDALLQIRLGYAEFEAR